MVRWCQGEGWWTSVEVSTIHIPHPHTLPNHHSIIHHHQHLPRVPSKCMPVVVVGVGVGHLVVMDQLGVVGVGVSGGIGREMLAKVTTMPLMHSGRTIR